MGFLRILISAMAGMFVLGVAFLLIDTAVGFAPHDTSVEGSAQSVSGAMQPFRPAVSLDHLIVYALVFLVLLIIYGCYYIYNLGKTSGEED